MYLNKIARHRHMTETSLITYVAKYFEGMIIDVRIRNVVGHMRSGTGRILAFLRSTISFIMHMGAKASSRISSHFAIYVMIDCTQSTLIANIRIVMSWR